eukprot:10603236-Lingulodinium_polyedra.AAC.1
MQLFSKDGLLVISKRLEAVIDEHCSRNLRGRLDAATLQTLRSGCAVAAEKVPNIELLPQRRGVTAALSIWA